MAIPKTIFQTYKNQSLPVLTRWHIQRLRNRNPNYAYQFFTDESISEFILNEYGRKIFELYNRISIGAAKADFFRYAILFKKGGIYLDIDSLILAKLDDFILPTDSAIISLESNLRFYIQWALVYEPGHLFLKRTLEKVIENLETNRYPHDVHKMTGPTVYTEAIQECLEMNNQYNYRQVGVDYDQKFKFHYRFSKFFLYGLFRNEHWRVKQHKHSVLKD